MNVHPKVAMIAFNLACYASVTGRMEDAKERLRNAIGLSDREIARCTRRFSFVRLPASQEARPDALRENVATFTYPLVTLGNWVDFFWNRADGKLRRSSI